MFLAMANKIWLKQLSSRSKDAANIHKSKVAQNSNKSVQFFTCSNTFAFSRKLHFDFLKSDNTEICNV